VVKYPISEQGFANIMGDGRLMCDIPAEYPIHLIVKTGFMLDRYDSVDFIREEDRRSLTANFWGADNFGTARPEFPVRTKSRQDRCYVHRPVPETAVIDKISNFDVGKVPMYQIFS
jgi:hypothetical protein